MTKYTVDQRVWKVFQTDITGEIFVTAKLINKTQHLTEWNLPMNHTKFILVTKPR